MPILNLPYFVGNDTLPASTPIPVLLAASYNNYAPAEGPGWLLNVSAAVEA